MEMDELTNRLHRALRDKQDLDSIAEILDEGAQVNAVDRYGNTSLHVATSFHPSAEALVLLLDRGANLFAKGYMQRSPLHSAVLSRESPKELLITLLDKGAEVNATDENGFTALHYSAERQQPELTALLLERGFHYNATSKWGCMPLHRAAQCNTSEVIRLLLEWGAYMEAKTKQGSTPLHSAAEANSRSEALAFLLEKGADIEATDNSGRTPLLRAAKQNTAAVVNALLAGGADIDATDQMDMTALQWAASHNKKEVVGLLLSKGADIQTRTGKGRTVLHSAAQFSSDPEVISLLCKKKVSVKALDSEGNSALHCAAKNRSEKAAEIAKLLANCEAKFLCKRNKAGQLPLGIARSDAEGNRALVPVFQRLMDVADSPPTGINCFGRLKRSEPEQVDSDDGREETVPLERRASRPSKETVHRELQAAMQSEQKDEFQQLIEQGALHKVLDDDQLDFLAEALQFIRQRYEDPVQPLSVKWQAMTVMELACQLGKIRVIQELHAINPRLLTDSNALTMATPDSDVLLLFTNVSNEMISSVNDKGQSLAHHLAMSLGDEDKLVQIASVLIRDSAKLEPDRAGLTPVTLSIENNKLKLLDFFLEKDRTAARHGSPSPVWSCAVTSNVGAAKKLIPYLAEEDLLQPGPDTSTPYLVARVRKDVEMIQVLREKLPWREVERVDGLFQRQSSAQNKLELVRSALQEKTRLIPVFNERACPAWEGNTTSAAAATAAIKPEEAISQFVLEVCGIEHSKSNLIADLVRELEDCNENHSNYESNQTCRLISDLLKLVSRIEREFQEHPVFQHLEPDFILIGSLAESTRLGMGNELDITIRFKRLKAEHFIKGASSFEVCLSEQGIELFSQSQLEHLILDGDKLNSFRFMMDILDALVLFVERIRIPHRMAIVMKNRYFEASDCAQCQEVSEKMYKASLFPPQSHCMDCLPAVTMTKLGPCLLLQWRNNSSSKPINCSIDMIPVLSHSASTAELFEQMVQTLINVKPEGWEKTMKSYLERDRIVANAPQAGETSFALKIQNFGPEPNFMVRAGQSLEKEIFKCPNLKDVYIYLKGLRILLGISNLKSYFAKKVLMKPEVQAYAKSNPSKLQLFYQAICQPELRPYFEDKIDYGRLREDIRLRKTDIIVYKA